MESEPVSKQRAPVGYRAVRDQVIAGPLGPMRIEANRLTTDPFVIGMLQRAGVKLLADYGD